MRGRFLELMKFIRSLHLFLSITLLTLLQNYSLSEFLKPTQQQQYFAVEVFPFIDSFRD